MSTMEVPIVGPLADGIFSFAEKNPVVNHLPKSLKVVYLWALGVVKEAAAIFAVALTLGGALYYNFPAFASTFPHWLGGGSVYWGYVLAVLGGFTFVVVVVAVLSGARADVLSGREKRAKAFDDMKVPLALLLLGWLITGYIA